MSLDEDVRALERAARAGGTREWLAFAHALERAGTRLPAWETAAGTWGRTARIEGDALTAPPEERWRAPARGAVLASVLGVVVEREKRVAVLEPATGAVRFEVEGYAAGLAGGLVLVEALDSSRVSAHDLLSGARAWELATEPEQAIAVDGNLLFRWDRGLLRRARFDRTSLVELEPFAPNVRLWGHPSLLACGGVVAVVSSARTAVLASDGRALGELDGATALDERGVLASELDAISLHALDGSILWRVARGSDPAWTRISPLALAPDFVVAGVATPVGSKLVLLDRATGAVRGEHPAVFAHALPVVVRDVVHALTGVTAFACDAHGRELWSWPAPPRVRRLVPLWGGLLVATPEEVIALGR